MERKDQEVLDQETVDRDEAAVSRLVGELKHVDAPANFERRVMSRIADGAPAKRSFFGMPTLAYAAALVSVLIVAGLYVLNSYRPGPVIVDVDHAAPALTSEQPLAGPPAADQPTSNETAVASSSPTQENARPANSRRASVTPANPETTPGGGSDVYSVRSPKIVKPEGMDPNATIPVREMLSMIGVNADYAGSWKVTQVIANSSAARSGVQVGDIVVAMGEHDISNKTDFPGSGSIGSLRVKRGGKLVDIKLK